MAKPPKPPVRSDFFDGSGDPVLGPQIVKALGNVARPWLGYLNEITSASSSGTTSGVAPNIVTATAAVSYQLSGNGPQNAVISGVISLPTTDPAYSLLTEIDVVAIDPAGNEHALGKFTGWVPGSTVLNYSAAVEPQPLADETWTVEFRCYDVNGNLTQNPLTLTVVLHPASLTSLSVTERTDLRYSDQNGSLHTVLDFSPTPANGQFPMVVTLWVDRNDGNGWEWQGTFTVDTGSPTIELGQRTFGADGSPVDGPYWVPTDPTQVNWKAAAIAGAVNQTATPPDGYVQTAFTVQPVGLSPSNSLSNAFFLPNPASGDNRVYRLNEPGIWIWDFWELDWDEPTFATDPNYWFSSVTVQKGYELTVTATITSGTDVVVTSGSIPNIGSTQAPYDVHCGSDPVVLMSAWHSTTHITLANAVSNGTGVTVKLWIPSPVTGTDDEGRDDDILIYRGRQIADSGELPGGLIEGPTGATIQLMGADNPGNPFWTFPPALNIDGSTNLYRTFRFRLYAISRLAQLPSGNPNVHTLQKCWTASADHYDLTPDPQAHAIDLGLVNPRSVAPTLGFDASSRLSFFGIPVLSSLPTLPTYYPQGSIIQLTASAGGVTNGFYKNTAATGLTPVWVSTQDPTTLLDGAIKSNTTIAANQITAGTIVAGVIYAGNINASQITAGTLTVAGTGANPGLIDVLDGSNAVVAWIGNLLGGLYGVWAKAFYAGGVDPAHAIVSLSGSNGAIAACTLTLNVGGVTTTVDNSLDSSLSANVGLKVKDNSSGIYAAVEPQGYHVVDGSGNTMLFLGKSPLGTYGDLDIRDFYNSRSINLNPNLQTISIGTLSPQQVLTVRQTGPGNPSFAVLADAQTWCQNLYNALKSGTGHGLLT